MIRAWLDLIWCLMWLIISDTWIANRMRDTPHASMFDDLSGDEKMVASALLAFRVAVVCVLVLVFALGAFAMWLIVKI